MLLQIYFCAYRFSRDYNYYYKIFYITKNMSCSSNYPFEKVVLIIGFKVNRYLCILDLIKTMDFNIGEGSDGGRVVKFLACGVGGPGLRYGWNTAKAT